MPLLIVMKEFSPEVNDIVRVMSLDSEGTHDYSSRIEDVTDEGITLSWPSHGGIPVPFHPSEKLCLYLTREDAVYSLDASVAAFASRPIPVLKVTPQSSIRRIQRRENVRVPLSLSVLLIGKPGGSPSPQPQKDVEALLIETTTLNISGGGALIEHTSSIPVDSTFKIRLHLPERPSPVRGEAKVCRCDAHLNAKRRKVFRVGLTFTTLEEGDRSCIIRYVLQQQRHRVRL